ncbi:MAG: helix-hairpin-helix domain-containing protein [Pyramidobacter sp.]
MDNRTKFVLLAGAALLCIGSAGLLVHTFVGSWEEELPTTVAGPAPTFQRQRPALQSDGAETRHYAYITGAVRNPGVYAISEDTRVFNLVEAAGGLRYDVDDRKINLAAPVRDGAHVHIDSAPFSAADRDRKSSDKAGKSDHRGKGTQYVYVNSAGEAELCTLPGIGPSLARRIIEYRQSHGAFQSPDDLCDVPGIGRTKVELIAFLLRF